MAGQRLTDKTALAENTANDDKLMVVDTSDTTGSSAGTSKKIDSKYIIQTDKIAVSNAELQAMDNSGSAGTFKQLVSAPGSDYFILPLSVQIHCTYASTTETSNNNMFVSFDPTDSTNYWGQVGRIMSSRTTNYVYMTFFRTSNSLALYDASIQNLPLKLSSSGNFNGGWSANVYVTYQIVKA